MTGMGTGVKGLRYLGSIGYCEDCEILLHGFATVSSVTYC